MKETKRKRDLTESTADNTQEPKKPMHPGRGLKVRLPDDVGTHPYHRNVPSAPRAKRDCECFRISRTEGQRIVNVLGLRAPRAEGLGVF